MDQTGAVSAGLRIEYRALDALIPYERNPGTHSGQQIAQIAASIKEFGFTNPVLLYGRESCAEKAVKRGKEHGHDG